MHVFYVSFVEDILHIVEEALYLIYSSTQNGMFHCSTFYNDVSSQLIELHVLLHNRAKIRSHCILVHGNIPTEWAELL